MSAALEILGAESAVLENATSMLALFGYIVSKAREVRRFRADCAALSNTCVSLYLTFLQQRSSLTPTQLRNELWSCIQDTSLLVLECLNWNIAHIAFDVVVRHKLKSLKSRLDDAGKAFGLEVLVSRTNKYPLMTSVAL